MQETQVWSLVWEDPHATEQLSLCATTTEPRHPTVRASPQEKPPQWEAHAVQLETSPHLPRLEKARA